MAPKKPSETGRSNKIRFVLVEADISDGNLSELTQAITSALRPSAVRILPPKVTPPQLPTNGNETPVEEIEIGAEGLEIETEDETDSEPKPAKPKKFKPPVYLAALVEGEKGKAFKELATAKAPKSKSSKYLVSAFWLKEQGEATANADKVYTCFKTAGWSTGFNDWNQTFHNLVHSEHMRKEGQGEFALNPLGEDAVNKGTE